MCKRDFLNTSILKIRNSRKKFQTSQPQAFGAALQQAVPQQNIIMPQYDAKGQTVVQTPQAQNNYQPYQQQQQYQNNYYGQQQQGQQYGQQV